jgi:hypothetical protein
MGGVPVPPADPGPADPGPALPGRSTEEPVPYLERSQLVAETSQPVPPAVLSPRAKFGLWALRVFVILVSLMVIWAFIGQQH